MTTKSQIIWTILPYGITDNKRRVSVVVSPRLKPENIDEEVLGAFSEFLNWPKTLKDAKFTVEIEGISTPLELIRPTEFDFEYASNLWSKLFNANTPVEGFQYTDMSKVNLRSYPIRNILGYLKKHYTRLALESPLEYPRLLPLDKMNPALKDMIEEVSGSLDFFLGKQVDFCFFKRFFDKKFEATIDELVFGTDGGILRDVPSSLTKNVTLPKMTPKRLRVMNPDWKDWQTLRFCSEREYDFYQADRFYRRSRPTEPWLRRPDFKPIPFPKTPDYDFHSIIATLDDYPELMRKLGLVLDFDLSEHIIPAEGKLRLRIEWSNQHIHNTDVTPWTAFLNSQDRFITRPLNRNGHQMVDGLLNLVKTDDKYQTENYSGLFDIYQVDPDGAALKTINFLLTEQNLLELSNCSPQTYGEVTYTTGDEQGFAALRSGGLGVARHGRAVDVATDASVATEMNELIEDEGDDGSDITLFAEDVHRGYRVDVAAVPNTSEQGVWRTLCARVGKYRLVDDPNGEEIDLAPDEGYVCGASTTSDGPNSVNPEDHYLHESLFRWTGWSLCTPRPGKAIKDNQNGNIQGEELVDSADEVAFKNGCGVIATFKAQKGSLPRLRFGQLYRFRARIVDLAGNSLAMDDPLLLNNFFMGASEAAGYWRFEPIDPPVVVHRTRVSEGESLERMVIRSNYNASTSEYLESEPFKSAINLSDSQDFEYGVVNERHFVPPKSSQQQCETHGLFDPYFGNPAQIKDGYAIAARDERTLNDEVSEDTQIELVTPAAINAVATTAELPLELPSETNPVGDRMVGGQYVVHREAQITTPWLPDGAAGGIAIRAMTGHTLPGVTAPKKLGSPDSSCEIKTIPKKNVSDPDEFVILIRHGGSWPDYNGFRLILAERKAKITSVPDIDGNTEVFLDLGEPKWNETERTLTFFVPKGRIVRLVYSSFANKNLTDSLGVLHEKLIESFGILQWEPNENNRNYICEGTLCGANWLITPFRELALVHATQAPVWAPVFSDTLKLDRSLGSHDVNLRCDRVNLHRYSTSKFEVEAEWSEWVDDLSKSRPERVRFQGKLGEIRLDGNIKLEKGDDYDNFSLKAAVDAQMSDLDVTTVQQRGDVHALGDTRFRLIKYTMRATTRFREYLPPSIYEDQEHVTRVGPIATGSSMWLPIDETDRGAPILSTSYSGSKVSDQQSLVLASTPPVDPRVLYVVPTMRWQSNKTSSVHAVTRYGNGLRVWLDRPWFSSGDGELLGVVICNRPHITMNVVNALPPTITYGHFSDIPDVFQPFVTQWGVDPFWDSTLPKLQVNETDFPARVTSEKVKLQEIPNSPDDIIVVGHRVHWDDTRGLWYCDIEINSGENYMPFVRLALVRYQPNALSGAKISKVVLTDFTQVLPYRYATVKVENKLVTAKLSGPNPNTGPMSKDDPYMANSFRAQQRDIGRNRVELVLQTRDPLIDSDLAWTDTQILVSQVVGDKTQSIANLTQPITLMEDTLSTDLPTNSTTNTLSATAKTFEVTPRAGGTVQLETQLDLSKQQIVSDINVVMPLPVFTIPFWEATTPLPSTSVPRRLMLREFERFYSDDVVVTSGRRVIEERLVFAAIIPL